MLGSSYIKGSKLVFKPDAWENTRLRELARSDQLTSPREFLNASWQEFYQTEGATPIPSTAPPAVHCFSCRAA